MYSREGDAPAEPKSTAGRRPPEAEPKLDSGSAGASPSIIDARILERFNFASSGFRSTSCHCFPLYSAEAVQIAARKSTAWGLSTTPKQWHRKTQGETALGRFCRLTLCVETVFSILPRDRDLVARLGT